MTDKLRITGSQTEEVNQKINLPISLTVSGENTKYDLFRVNVVLNDCSSVEIDKDTLEAIVKDKIKSEFSLCQPDSKFRFEDSLDLLSRDQETNLILHFRRSQLESTIEKPFGYILKVSGKDRKRYSLFKVDAYQKAVPIFSNDYRLNFEIDNSAKSVIQKIPGQIWLYNN